MGLRTRSWDPDSVFQRAQMWDLTTPGEWTIRITGAEVPTDKTQVVYWAAFLHQGQ
jgi:hypothetical protein